MQAARAPLSRAATVLAGWAQVAAVFLSPGLGTSGKSPCPACVIAPDCCGEAFGKISIQDEGNSARCKTYMLNKECNREDNWRSLPLWCAVSPSRSLARSLSYPLLYPLSFFFFRATGGSGPSATRAFQFLFQKVEVGERPPPSFFRQAYGGELPLSLSLSLCLQTPRLEHALQAELVYSGRCLMTWTMLSTCLLFLHWLFRQTARTRNSTSTEPCWIETAPLTSATGLELQLQLFTDTGSNLTEPPK